MFIEVADLRKKTGYEKEFTGKISRLEIELQGDVYEFRDLRVDGLAKNVSGKIYVKGNMKAMVNLNCSLCLSPFSTSMDVPFEETYYAASSRDLNEIDGIGRNYQGDQINLRDVIIEGLILSLPMKPVCNSACKGLCPTCGCNLHAEKCECSGQAIDPRLSALDGYFNGIKNRG